MSAPISLAAASLLGDVEIAVTELPIALARRTCGNRRQLDFYDLTSAKILISPQISILLSSLTEPAHPHLAKSSNADDSDPLPATHCAPVLQRGEPDKYTHYTIDNKCSADLYKCTLHCDSSAENWSCSLQGVASWHLRDYRYQQLFSK